MVNNKLFFAICLTTLLYIGCRAQLGEENLKHGGSQTNKVAPSESDNHDHLNSTTQPPQTSTEKTTPITKSTTPITKPTTPPTKPTVTTTAPPSSSSTPSPSTSELPPNSTTVAPKPTPNPAPMHDRSFDLPSFIGGVILSLGLAAIGYVVFKFYKTRTDPNYRTL